MLWLRTPVKFKSHELRKSNIPSPGSFSSVACSMYDFHSYKNRNAFWLLFTFPVADFPPSELPSPSLWSPCLGKRCGGSYSSTLLCSFALSLDGTGTGILEVKEANPKCSHVLENISTSDKS